MVVIVSIQIVWYRWKDCKIHESSNFYDIKLKHNNMGKLYTFKKQISGFNKKFNTNTQWRADVKRYKRRKACLNKIKEWKNSVAQNSTLHFIQWRFNNNALHEVSRSRSS